MIPRAGQWKDALVDVSVDADLSEEVDLGAPFEDLVVLIPTIKSATVTVHVAKEKGGTYYPLHILDDDATGSFVSANTAATTSNCIIFRIGGFQFVKIALGATQDNDTTFVIRGLNPV